MILPTFISPQSHYCIPSFHPLSIKRALGALSRSPDIGLKRIQENRMKMPSIVPENSELLTEPGGSSAHRGRSGDDRMFSTNNP